jgi:hypothetical protein
MEQTKFELSLANNSLHFDPYGHEDRRVALPSITLPPEIEREDWMAYACENPWMISSRSIWQRTPHGIQLKD